MATESEGQVLERNRKRGTVYALRFRAYGERRYLTLGEEAEGWTREHAEGELRRVLADVKRGFWVSPLRKPRPQRRRNLLGTTPDFRPFATALVFSRGPGRRGVRRVPAVGPRSPVALLRGLEPSGDRH